MADEAVVAARGLRRNFGSFTAVRDFDLQVRRGEVVGLLGANGAGKTTAIRMLCGTLPPTAGAVQVAGVDMVRRPRRARSRIGYVTQRFTLYGELSVVENLRLQAGLYGVTGPLRQERIELALRRFDLADAAHQRAARLPLGHQRRLAVAAALLHQPDVLFLDEPTSGIDPLARQQLWELVYGLAAAGMGVLVTTHYLDEALFCDRLALMNRGRVIASGSPESLLAQPLDSALLEVRGPDDAACAAWLARQPQVREVLPRAGRARVRLQPGVGAGDWAAQVTRQAAADGLALHVEPGAAPELEDVFVALLEREEAAP